MSFNAIGSVSSMRCCSQPGTIGSQTLGLPVGLAFPPENVCPARQVLRVGLREQSFECVEMRRIHALPQGHLLVDNETSPQTPECSDHRRPFRAATR
jgi:hypothetical protein